MSTFNNVGTLSRASLAHHNSHLTVYIGRFQIFHNGHLKIIKTALEQSDTLAILIGSADQPRDTFNPFTYEERKQVILESIPVDDRSRIFFAPLLDWPLNDDKWKRGVQDAVNDAKEFFTLDSNAVISLIGHSKDSSSFYLKKFRQWHSINVPNYMGISATPFREAYFRDHIVENGLKYPHWLVNPKDWKAWCKANEETLPYSTVAFLETFYKSEDYKDVVEEYEFIRSHNKMYEGLKWPPIFTTVDAVVTHSGNVLMIRRKNRPGMNRLALPGGYVNADEYILDALIRELKEETRIGVSKDMLLKCIVNQKVIDTPKRSARGRIITHAYHIALPDSVEPIRIRAGDDAKKANWIPFADVHRNECFEDHAHIFNHFVNVL